MDSNAVTTEDRKHDGLPISGSHKGYLDAPHSPVPVDGDIGWNCVRAWLLSFRNHSLADWVSPTAVCRTTSWKERWSLPFLREIPVCGRESR